MRFIWVIFLTLLMVSTASAHTRSQSFSSWEIDEQTARFTYAVDPARVTQLGELYPDETDLRVWLDRHVRDNIAMTQAGKPCQLKELRPVGSGQRILRLSGIFICETSIQKTRADVRISSFFEVSPTHIHLARLEGTDMSSDFVLREGAEHFTLAAKAAPKFIRDFIKVGFHHVLSGLDHMVFLLALAMVARTPRRAILCITGFTLGHTLSLGLVTYGLITPDEPLIEALIGFTIAAIALEAGVALGLDRFRAMLALAVLALIVTLVPLSGTSALGLGILLVIYALASGKIAQDHAVKILPVMTIAFGIIHGAGFAGGLLELSLSQTDIWRPLIGFNIGVELAQLLTLAIVYGLAWIISRGINIRYAELMASGLIFGMGCFWFAQRLWS